MAYRLAAYVVGTTDVDSVQSSMTLEQEAGWMAYHRIEPIGPIGVWRALARCQSMQNEKAEDWMFLPWMRREDVHQPVSGAQVNELFRRD